MKPALFDYAAPGSVDETLTILSELGPEARILAGGQSLGPLLNLRLAQPGTIVDINRVPGLAGISTNDDALEIGAMTRQRTVEVSSDIDSGWPMITEAVAHIGHRTIRNRGTVGGSVAHADPAAELPAVLLALDGEILMASREAERSMPARDFFAGPFMTALEQAEMVIGLRVPRRPSDETQVWVEVSRRHGDFALIGVAAAVSWNDDESMARVSLAYSGASWAPWQPPYEIVASFAGTAADEATLSEIGSLIAENADPPDDVHSTAAHRRRLMAVLTGRALALCAGRRERGAP